MLAAVLLGCQPSPAPTAPSSEVAASLEPTAAATAGSSSGPIASVPPAIVSPTSADLIRAAVEAGALDRETGLLYRVYAVFGDQRLPEEFRSDVVVEDGAALAAARNELDQVRPEIADELRPFLVRPTDPSSVFYDVRATAAAYVRLASARQPGSALPLAAAPAPVVCNSVSGWGYALGDSSFKVWGECGTPADDANIQQLAAMVQGFWDAETAYMGIEPLADDGTPDPDEWLNDGGGDGRIDFYLVNGCQTRGGTCHALGANSLAETLAAPPHETLKGVGIYSSYVLVPVSLLASDVRLTRASVAHEFFHVLQNAMNFDGTLTQGGTDYHWIVEASAKWAEWHFSGVDDNVIPWHGQFQVTDQPLDSVANGNAYASFTWPLFMEQQSGDPDDMAYLWNGLVGQPDEFAVTRTIDALLPFEDNFRIFAMRNWNQELGIGDPMDPLLPLPPTTPGRPRPASVHRWADTELHGKARGQPYRLDEHILGLYAKYAPFTVADDVGQIVLDLSGLGPADRYDADVLMKIKDKGWERRKLKKGITTWCTDNPDDDVESFVVVVSNHDDGGFSVSGRWTVEALLEPCQSYEVDITWTDVYDDIADTFTFHGVIDMVDQATSGNGVVNLIGAGTIGGQRPGWTKCNPGLDTVPSGNGDAIFVASIQGDTIAISAFPDLSAADFGVSTEPFFLDRKGGTLTIKSDGNVGGTLCPHSWHGTITATIKLPEPAGNAQGD